MPDLDYISRRLNARSYEALEAFKMELASLIRHAAANNGLQNSRTYLQVEDIALQVFNKHALDAAQFTFNSSEDTGFEVTNALKYCMGRMVDMIGQEISQPNGLSNSAHSDTYATIVNRTKVKLAEKRDSLIDDYFNGMMGNQRMKKDPTINIVQNNSPGAVHRSARTSTSRHTIKAISRSSRSSIKLWPRRSSQR